MPRISIVTICFNQFEYLPRCVESVTEQGFDDYEHIVVDPGSTDGSREWLATKQNSRLKAVLKPDTGPAQGLNNGLQMCRGEILVYLNSDDELAPGALQSIHELHEKYPDVDVIVGNGWTIDPASGPIGFVRSDRFTPLRYALAVGNIMQQSTSFKWHLFERGLSFNEDNRSVWDTELLFDAHAMGAKFMNVDECLGYFRLHPDSITVSQRHAKEIRIHQDRMVAYALGGRAVGWSLPLSYACRVGKKMKNTYRNLRQRPSFPGR